MAKKPLKKKTWTVEVEARWMVEVQAATEEEATELAEDKAFNHPHHGADNPDSVDTHVFAVNDID